MSDAGVAISLTSTASQGAFLNVLINCTSLSNKQLGNELLTKSENTNSGISIKSKFMLDEIIQRIKNLMKKIYTLIIFLFLHLLSMDKPINKIQRSARQKSNSRHAC